MLATLPRMAKKKSDLKPAAELVHKTGTVRLREDLVDMISVISTERKMDVAALLDSLLRDQVTDLYKKVILERADQLRK